MEEVLVTAQDLFEATKEARIVIEGKTKEELCEEWYEWFKKKSPSYIRDAVKKGLFRVTFELPFQPTLLPSGEVDGKCYNWNGKPLYKRLTEVLPGCKIEFCEEEYEESCAVPFPGFVLEISWKLKKKKKGFVTAEDSMVPSSTTTMTTTTMSTTAVSSTTMSTTAVSTSSDSP